MNSGIRFSVALIVVVMVLLGFYYASLEDGAGEEAESSPPEVERVVDTPRVAAEGSPPSGRLEPPVVREPQPGPATDDEPDDIVDGVATDEPGMDDSEGREFDEFPIEVATAPDDDVREVIDTEELVPDSGESTDAGDSAGETESEAAAADEADEIVDEDEVLGDSSSAASRSEPLDSGPEAGSRGGEASGLVPVRNPRSAGVGIHRLASIERDGQLANAALRVLAEATELGIIDGPRNTVWIPLPAGVDARLLEDAIVGRVAGATSPLVLIHNTEAGAVDLAGKVGSTEVIGSDTSGIWGVSFRVTPEAMDGIRISTRRFQGESVVWVGGGRVLAVDRPVIAISGRGRLPVNFQSEAAAVEAAEMLQAAATAVGTRPSENNRGGSDAGNVIVGAGSLPPDQYTEYVVKPGDSFERIAVWWFGDANRHSLIAEANPYAESSRLTIGQKLRLPPRDAVLQVEIPAVDATGRRGPYIVRSGDTLGRIAREAYGKASLWPRIYEANKAVIGENPENLKVGMKLEIPE
jgi:nucleoid-associated protein YgaU